MNWLLFSVLFGSLNVLSHAEKAFAQPAPDYFCASKMYPNYYTFTLTGPRRLSARVSIYGDDPVYADFTIRHRIARDPSVNAIELLKRDGAVAYVLTFSSKGIALSDRARADKTITCQVGRNR